MKLGDLKRHLRKHDCFVLRDRGDHTVYQNKVNGKTAPVPRHAEIDNVLARIICKQLGIDRP